jgi:hypothetical protein
LEGRCPSRRELSDDQRGEAAVVGSFPKEGESHRG